MSMRMSVRSGAATTTGMMTRKMRMVSYGKD